MTHVNISRVTSFTDWQITAWADVERDWELGRRKDVNGKCGVMIQRGSWAGRYCPKTAGQGTPYVGYGFCVGHGGAKKYGRAYGAIEMAHAFAEEYDLSPWESLLYVIRITAGRVRYCERVLASAMSDDEIEGKVKVDASGEGTPLGVDEDGTLRTGRNMRWWVETSERERVLLAKVSKAAIDAGVAQLLVSREIEQGDLLADSLIRVYDALEASGADEMVLAVTREAMKKELLSLGAKDIGNRASQSDTNHHTPGMIELEGPKDTDK